jgi:hypothetical protein
LTRKEINRALKTALKYLRPSQVRYRTDDGVMRLLVVSEQFASLSFTNRLMLCLARIQTVKKLDDKFLFVLVPVTAKEHRERGNTWLR